MVKQYVWMVGGRERYFKMQYYPSNNWERRAPSDLGMNPDRLNSAVGFAQDNESEIPQDLSDHEEIHAIRTRQDSERTYGDEMHYAKVIGPLPRRRGDPAGLVIKDGYIVAEWGDTHRVDMANSISKSFISSVAGLAFDEGIIKDVHNELRTVILDGGFESPQNRKITWENLLQQTSEWEGALFGKPDAIDRRNGRDRKLYSSGNFWEYNNVRVNRLSLSLLRVLERSLPRYLEEKMMDPIDSSSTMKWHGYKNSDVLVDDLTDGNMIKSVACGGHWGGGVWINTRDLARYGLLYCRNGDWDGESILSDEWIEKSTAPCDENKSYGYLWWLNTDKELWQDLPSDSYAAIGRGSNVVWVYPEEDLVVVCRWLKSDSSGLDRFPNQNRLFNRILNSVY